MESSLLYRVMLQGLLQMQFVPSTADRAATESIKENRSEKKEKRKRKWGETGKGTGKKGRIYVCSFCRRCSWTGFYIYDIHCRTTDSVKNMRSSYPSLHTEGLFSVFTYTHKHSHRSEYNSTYGLVRTLLNRCCQILRLWKILRVALLHFWLPLQGCCKEIINHKDLSVKVLSRSLQKLTEKQKTIDWQVKCSNLE